MVILLIEIIIAIFMPILGIPLIIVTIPILILKSFGNGCCDIIKSFISNKEKEERFAIARSTQQQITNLTALYASSERLRLVDEKLRLLKNQ
jgi:hypothetical protein